MEIGELIRKYREENLLGQSELSQKIGISQKALSFIEGGQTKVPQKVTLRKIGEVLGISNQEIISSLTNTKQQSKTDEYETTTTTSDFNPATGGYDQNKTKTGFVFWEKTMTTKGGETAEVLLNDDCMRWVKK